LFIHWGIYSPLADGEWVMQHRKIADASYQQLANQFNPTAFDADAWVQPRLMAFLQAQGNIEPEEMARTFNCGIGMAIVVAEADVTSATAELEAAGETVYRIGQIASGEKGCTVTGSVETWSAKADWSATHHG
jgi:hypothetical protein